MGYDTAHNCSMPHRSALQFCLQSRALVRQWRTRLSIGLPSERSERSSGSQSQPDLGHLENKSFIRTHSASLSPFLNESFILKKEEEDFSHSWELRVQDQDTSGFHVWYNHHDIRMAPHCILQREEGHVLTRWGKESHEERTQLLQGVLNVHYMWQSPHDLNTEFHSRFSAGD